MSKKVIKTKRAKAKKPIKSPVSFADLLIIKESVKKIGDYDRFMQAVNFYKIFRK